MESMGSKLSPGAQQLMDMVRFQQQVGRNGFCPGTLKNLSDPGARVVQVG